jgi:cation transport regulator
MPYAQNDDLPASVRHVLPAHAQDIYRAAFNDAYQRYGT